MEMREVIGELALKGTFIDKESCTETNAFTFLVQASGKSSAAVYPGLEGTVPSRDAAGHPRLCWK